MAGEPAAQQPTTRGLAPSAPSYTRPQQSLCTTTYTFKALLASPLTPISSLSQRSNPASQHASRGPFCLSPTQPGMAGRHSSAGRYAGRPPTRTPGGVRALLRFGVRFGREDRGGSSSLPSPSSSISSSPSLIAAAAAAATAAAAVPRLLRDGLPVPPLTAPSDAGLTSALPLSPSCSPSSPSAPLPPSMLPGCSSCTPEKRCTRLSFPCGCCVYRSTRATLSRVSHRGRFQGM